MGITQGGHAIMLSVALSQDMKDAVSEVLGQHPGRHQKGTPHVTVAWVGRNLDRSVGTLMENAQKRTMRLVPRTVLLRPSLDLFGKYRDHLVAHVEKSPLLVEYSKRVWRELTGAQPNSVWQPHVTLCVLEYHYSSTVDAISQRALDRLVKATEQPLTVTAVTAKIGKQRTVVKNVC